MSDVDDVYEELTHHGASTMGGPQTYDYGMREFALVDKSGNLVRVGSPVA